MHLLKSVAKLTPFTELSNIFAEKLAEGMGKRVLGIGNALVDIMVKVESDERLSEFSLPKGSMQLVDEEKSDYVKKGLEKDDKSVSPGGSAANTIHALGMLGTHPGFIGSTGHDDTGELFIRELKNAGVDPIIFRRSCPTGTAVALVTPDSERTFATHLGAAVELNAGELNEDLFSGYDILYLEGYLIINYDLTLKACRLAREHGMKVALDLSSYNVVESNRERFEEIMTGYVDILFANEEEAKAFTGRLPEEALGILAGICPVAVVKTGSRGSLIRRGEEIVRVEAIDVIPVDTTGAGDMYAAGFLYGYAGEATLERCGEFGSFLAGSVIQYMGAKLPPGEWPSIKARLRI